MWWTNQQQSQYQTLLCRECLTEFGSKVHSPEWQSYNLLWSSDKLC